MGWTNTVPRSVMRGVRGVATGILAAVATPLVYTPLRVVTKQAIKGGLWVAHGTQSVVEMTRAEWNEVVTEAQIEVRAEDRSVDVEDTASGGPTPDRSNATRTVAQEAPSATGPETVAAGTKLTEIKGVGDDYAQLLTVAGVSNVEDLADRDADSLRAALLTANEERSIVGRVPSVDRIAKWIERAAEHED